ncbi:amidohydrolase [Rhodococcus sp. NPDC057014]|uniref:amidohydrolase n=1 Tax=Rhodococcus sp. NPDC057014 TaxID=3346000 RepID=UPI0036322367
MPHIDPATLVLLRGTIRTLDPALPLATAVAIRDDTIVAVGSDTEIAAWIGPRTEVIDLAGACVVPGINDAHLHLALFAESRMASRLNLHDATSITEIRSQISSAAESLEEGTWIVGGSWHEKRIAEFTDGARAPHSTDLDIAGSATPVVLHHDSLHSVWVNGAALEVGGIDRHTPDPAGGHIVRDGSGNPTGLLLESAGSLVTRHIPETDRDHRLTAMADAMRHLNTLGVTSITDPVVWPQLLRDYVELRRQKRATVRVSALLHWDWPSTSSSDAGLAAALDISGATTGLGDDWVRVGGIKLFADGVPSAHTACMHDPYPDGSIGDLVTAGDDSGERCAELTRMVARAHRHRLDVQIHVTGDKAADLAIDAVAAAQRSDPWPDARHALIHATVLSADAPARLRAHKISVVTQSLFKYHSGPGMLSALGRERWNETFPVRRLLDAGVVVADSTDAPCVDPDWRLGMTTFTGGADHELARLPEGYELTAEEALVAWTTAGAFLDRAEGRKGALTPGALADMVVVDRDPLTAAPASLVNLGILLTVVGGEVVHRSVSTTTGGVRP